MIWMLHMDLDCLGTLRYEHDTSDLLGYIFLEYDTMICAMSLKSSNSASTYDFPLRFEL